MTYEIDETRSVYEEEVEETIQEMGYALFVICEQLSGVQYVAKERMKRHKRDLVAAACLDQPVKRHNEALNSAYEFIAAARRVDIAAQALDAAMKELDELRVDKYDDLPKYYKDHREADYEKRVNSLDHP